MTTRDRISPRVAGAADEALDWLVRQRAWELRLAQLEGATPTGLAARLASSIGGSARPGVVAGDPVGDVLADDFDAGLAGGCAHGPGHRHGAGECRVVRDEVDLLHDAIVVNDVEVADLDDVRVGGALPTCLRRIVVRQDQTVRAA
jgi:hypothetical protein